MIIWALASVVLSYLVTSADDSISGAAALVVMGFFAASGAVVGFIVHDSAWRQTCVIAAGLAAVGLSIPFYDYSIHSLGVFPMGALFGALVVAGIGAALRR